MLWSDQEKSEYMRQKCIRERASKAMRRRRGRKDVAPKNMDDDYGPDPVTHTRPPQSPLCTCSCCADSTTPTAWLTRTFVADPWVHHGIAAAHDAARARLDDGRAASLPGHCPSLQCSPHRRDL
jgi:hypothetical protein